MIYPYHKLSKQITFFLLNYCLLLKICQKKTFCTLTQNIFKIKIRVYPHYLRYPHSKKLLRQPLLSEQHKKYIVISKKSCTFVTIKFS